MTCEKIKDLIVASIMDGLDQEAEQRLRRHVAECSDCSAELEALGTLWAEVGLAAAPDPDSDAGAKLNESIRRFRAEETSRGRVGRKQFMAIAASILLFVGGAAVGAALSGDRSVAEDPGDGRPTFLVLMRGESSTPNVPVAAMDSWLAGLREEQRIVGGARLLPTGGAWFGPAPEPFNVGGVFELFGYMLIQAQDTEEARAIARSSPHIGSTGAVEVWPIR